VSAGQNAVGVSRGEYTPVALTCGALHLVNNAQGFTFKDDT